MIAFNKIVEYVLRWLKGLNRIKQNVMRICEYRRISAEGERYGDGISGFLNACYWKKKLPHFRCNICPSGSMNCAGNTKPPATISPLKVSSRSAGACPNQYKTRPGPKRCKYDSACGKTECRCVRTSPKRALESVQ